MTQPTDDSCRPVDLPDGTTIRVHGQGELTSQAREALGVLAEAVQRMAEAEPPNLRRIAIDAVTDSFDRAGLDVPLHRRVAAANAVLRALDKVGALVQPAAEEADLREQHNHALATIALVHEVAEAWAGEPGVGINGFAIATLALLNQRAEPAEPPTRFATGGAVRTHVMAPGDEYIPIAELRKRWADPGDTGGCIIPATKRPRDPAVEQAARDAFDMPGTAEARIARVRALHVPVEGLGYDCDEPDRDGCTYGSIAQACNECGHANEYAVRWPCPTIQALDGDTAKEPT